MINFSNWFFESENNNNSDNERIEIKPEPNEDKGKILRIRLGPWVRKEEGPEAEKKDSMPPMDFINLFNKSVNAQQFEHRYFYIEKNPSNPQDEGTLVIYSMKPYNIRPHVYVSDLEVKPRGLAAIRFLQRLTSMADKYNVTLECISQPLNVDDKVNAKRLKNLYMRFGFVPIKKLSNDELRRLPKPA